MLVLSENLSAASESDLLHGGPQCGGLAAVRELQADPDGTSKNPGLAGAVYRRREGFQEVHQARPGRLWVLDFDGGLTREQEPEQLPRREGKCCAAKPTKHARPKKERNPGKRKN